jgi:enoyl-CoA hydratase/carnithine racemase
MALSHGDRGSAFCLPGSRNGGFCHTPGVAVASKVHPRKALEMLLLSENVDAVEAQRIGLVNRLANNGEELGAMADAAAAKLVATSGHNTLRGKQGFYSHVDKPTIDAKYHDASEFMLDMFASNDQQEGIAAFFAKRPPIWRDS